MKKSLLIFMLLLSVILTYGSNAFADDYRLGPGDVLNIGVWGHEELQLKEVTVRPDGKFAFPLVGEIPAAGLSLAELSAQMTKELSQYVVEPKVTVNVVKFRTVRVYVLGEVRNPGMYEIEKSHNLLDAIGMAGGHTKYSAKKSVYIVYKETGQYKQVNYDSLLKKGDLSQNYSLGEGDVVYLASNHLNFAADILPYISSLYQVRHF